MKVSRSFSAVLIFFLLASSGISIADSESRKAKLKSCIATNLAEDKKKKNKKKVPSADYLLAMCGAELEFLLSELPVAIRHDARHHIKKDITNQLK